MTRSDTTADPRWLCLFGAWLMALLASLSALFLGEVMGMTPCVLCWYQRIAMFPLVVVLGVGLLSSDTTHSVRYASPLAWGGWLVALYHCLLYGGIIPPGLVPCGEGASCTEANLQLIGFVSIPLMSWLAFSLILVLLLLSKKGTINE